MALNERIGILALGDQAAKLGDNVELWFGDGTNAEDADVGDVKIRWDGTDLDMLPTVDDTVFKIGDGTTSFDLWLFGSAASKYISWDASTDDLKFEDGVSLMFGTGAGAGTGSAGDAELRWDGTDLDLLAAADDQIFKIGNGTNSWDIWLYGNTASDYLLWDASAGKLSLEGDAYLQLDSYRRTVTAKTGDYTLTAADSGGVFTTTGAAGAVNFTLPAVATSAGFEYTFVNTVDQNMTVTAPAGTLVVHNNAGATSLAFATASEKIGAAVKVTCDGSKWLAQVHLAAEAQTVTIA